MGMVVATMIADLMVARRAFDWWLGMPEPRPTCSIEGCGRAGIFQFTAASGDGTIATGSDEEWAAALAGATPVVLSWTNGHGVPDSEFVSAVIDDSGMAREPFEYFECYSHYVEEGE